MGGRGRKAVVGPTRLGPRSLARIPFPAASPPIEGAGLGFFTGVTLDF
jgi:hypothetical protein